MLQRGILVIGSSWSKVSSSWGRGGTCMREGPRPSQGHACVCRMHVVVSKAECGITVNLF